MIFNNVMNTQGPVGCSSCPTTRTFFLGSYRSCDQFALIPHFASICRSKSPSCVSRCPQTFHALSHYLVRFCSSTRRSPFPKYHVPIFKNISICRCYSAYEHSKFHEAYPRTSHLGPAASAPTPAPRIPLDISLETILSVFLVCVGLVLGAEELRPITWKVSAGKADRESGGGGPFQALEERLGFMDIRVGVLFFLSSLSCWSRAVETLLISRR